MALIAQFFISALAYGIGLAVFLLQIIFAIFLLVGLAFSLVIFLIAFPIFFIKYKFFEKQ